MRMYLANTINKFVLLFDALMTEAYNLGYMLLLMIYRPFPSFKNPHSSNEANCKTFIVKMSFSCMIIKKSFSQQRFCTWPRFKTDACDISEMAY